VKSALLLVFLSWAALLAQPQTTSGTISGHVFHSLTGAPIRKAAVELQHPDFSLYAETDAEGRYTFTGLPPGAYRLSSGHSAFHRQRSRQPIQLAEGAHATHHPFRLAPFAVISGRILDEEGEPAAGATVLLHRYAYRPGRGRWNRTGGATKTSDTGEFRFPGLSPGRYLVEAHSTRPPVNNHYRPSGAPLRPYVPVYYPNARRLADALPILLDLGQEIRGIDLQLTRAPLLPPVTIRGHATLPAAIPSTRVSISLNRDPSEQGPPTSASAVVDYPDFHFELRAPPGLYSLRANVNTGEPLAFASDELDIAGPIEDLVVPLVPAPRIAAQLSLLQGGAADFGNVRLRLWSFVTGNVTLIRSNSSGLFGEIFDKPLIPGSYAIEVDTESLPEGLFLHSVRHNGDEISPDAFDIRQSGRLDIILSRNAASLSGTVASTGQTPLPGALLVLVPQDDPARAIARAAQDQGRFAFSNLPPGKYQILVWDQPDNDFWRDPDLRSRHQKQATTVELAPGASLTVNLLHNPD